eukprot:scaffold95957_cov16-Prasinocladus_malaysianus.AAC.1
MHGCISEWEDGRMDGWMDGWMDAWMHGWTDEPTDRLTVRRPDGPTNRRMDASMHGCKHE